MHIQSQTMTSNEILKADVLDILFDQRNKQYGAYTLRKHYHKRLSIALGSSLGAVFLFFFLLPRNHSTVVIEKNNDDVVIKSMEVPKEMKKVLPLPPQKKSVLFKKKIFVPPVLVNKDVFTPPTDIRDLINSDISNKTIDGAINRGIFAIRQPIVTQVETKTVMEWKPDQKEPEFPGGQEAWLNFLRKHLMVPEELESGEKKKVEIRFIVSAEGFVTGFEVIQSAGKNFDNEVIRVLKKMPKWKPAVQNGQAVARSYTQPVTFIGVEQ